MKAKYTLVIITLLVGILTLLLVLTNFSPPAALAQNNIAALAFQQQQPTPTTPVTDSTEVGSTDGILIMGIVIVLIVTLPLMFRKRK